MQEEADGVRGQYKRRQTMLGSRCIPLKRMQTDEDADADEVKEPPTHAKCTLLVAHFDLIEILVGYRAESHRHTDSSCFLSSKVNIVKQLGRWAYLEISSHTRRHREMKHEIHCITP